jgi:hypothetical protein
MNKGITLTEYINMIKFLKSINSRFNLFYITGWPEIENSDVEEAKHFFNEIDITCYRKTNHVWGKLMLENKIPVNPNVQSDITMKFINTYNPVLSVDKQVLDQEYIQLLNNIGAQNRSIKTKNSLVKCDGGSNDKKLTAK